MPRGLQLWIKAARFPQVVEDTPGEGDKKLGWAELWYILFSSPFNHQMCLRVYCVLNETVSRGCGIRTGQLVSLFVRFQRHGLAGGSTLLVTSSESSDRGSSQFISCLWFKRACSLLPF